MRADSHSGSDQGATRMRDGLRPTVHLGRGAERRFRARHTGPLLTVSMLIATAANAAVVATIDTIDVGGVGGFGKAKHLDEAALADTTLDPTCAWDARLAAAASSVWCAGPFDAEVEACLAAVGTRLSTDLILCDARVVELPPNSLQLATVTAEAIAAIEAEPLLDLLSPEAQKQFEQEQQQQVALLEEQAQKRIETMPEDGQVVETARPDVEVAPDHARLVSEYDTKVDHQTVARGSRHEDMIARPKDETLTARPDPREATVPRPPDDSPEGQDPRAPAIPGSLRMRAPGALDPASIAQEAKIAGAFDGSTAAPGDGMSRARGNGAITQDARRPAEVAPGGGGAGGGTPRAPNLKPNEQVLERVAGGGSVDAIDDADEGDETALNSKRWINASFFNRAKRMIAQQWEPAQVWRRHDPTGAVYGFKTRTTVLRVSLTTAGTLANVVVVEPSGVDVLDEEAVRAFKAAAPFPNPPVSMAKDGLITFNFGFRFEIGGSRSDWKIFRAM